MSRERQFGLRGVSELAPSALANPGAVPAEPVQRPLWVDPPSQWENIDQLNYVALPAIGSIATILSYTVPIGRNGVIQKIANNFVGGGWVEGTGDVIWRILVDGAGIPGANSYTNILGSLGSPGQPGENFRLPRLRESGDYGRRLQQSGRAEWRHRGRWPTGGRAPGGLPVSERI